MEIEDGEAENSSSFVLLTEGCMSDILSQTSPRDACRAASISWGFKALADSDAVWERFLPSDYQDIISRAVSPVNYSSKKELYFRLCDSPILLDDGKMSFTLNKQNGKKCFLIGAKEFSIAWKETLVFWRWRSLPESRFAQVAELLAVCWLEIKGKFKTGMLSSDTTYAAYLVFKFAETTHGLDFPAKTLVRLRGREDAGEEEARTVYLRPSKSSFDHRLQTSRHTYAREIGWGPRMRTDGWMEIELGEFYNDLGDDSEVDIRFMETEQLRWKSGLILEGIHIRPKMGF